MSTNVHSNLGRDRDHLEAEANVARARLARTLEALDHRRHEFTDLRLQVRRHARTLLLAGGVFALTAFGLALVSVLRARAKARARPRERIQLFKTFWRRPERVELALKNEQRSFPAELGRRVLLGTLTWAALQLAKRGMPKLRA
jgi:hypothetical protein